MSSLRRINASRANGRLSKGPATSDGQGRSSANAIRHGLLAKCVVLENESGPCFDRLVTEHTRRFAPADGVEFGMIEEMAAAYWRMRRAWAIENRLMEKALRHQPPGDEAARIADAFAELAASPELNLLHATKPASTASISAPCTTSPCSEKPNYQPSPISGHLAPGSALAPAISTAREPGPEAKA
jgi:hypothetical protein